MGLDIFASGYPRLVSINVVTGAEDLIEETVTAGSLTRFRLGEPVYFDNPCAARRPLQWGEDLPLQFRIVDLDFEQGVVGVRQLTTARPFEETDGCSTPLSRLSPQTARPRTLRQKGRRHGQDE
jgi:hypothetical protein